MPGRTLDPSRLRIFSLTWLSHSPACFPTPFSSDSQYFYWSKTPNVFLHLVWPLPRSLATTYGISVDFSSLPYLDVSVQAVPHVYLWIQYTLHGHDSMWVSPFRNPWINAHLQLPKAYRSLSRLSSAPSAKAFALRPSSLDRFNLA